MQFIGGMIVVLGVVFAYACLVDPKKEEPNGKPDLFIIVSFVSLIVAICIVLAAISFRFGDWYKDRLKLSQVCPPIITPGAVRPGDGIAWQNWRRSENIEDHRR